MEKVLIIAEKPQIAQALEKIIPGQISEAKKGIVRKGNYIITCAYGHLLSLKEPEDYNENIKAGKWNSSRFTLKIGNKN